MVCALAVSLKYRLGYDDSLDVVGVHFVGGWIGSLWLGLFADNSLNSYIADVVGAESGLFAGGGVTQLGRQAAASAIVTVWSFGIAAVLAIVIKVTIGFRASTEAEVAGIDIAEHAESGYDLTPASGSTGAFALAGISSGGSTTATPTPDKPVSEKVAG
jgi:Amt family ammonium transporter